MTNSVGVWRPEVTVWPTSTFLDSTTPADGARMIVWPMLTRA